LVDKRPFTVGRGRRTQTKSTFNRPEKKETGISVSGAGGKSTKRKDILQTQGTKGETPLYLVGERPEISMRRLALREKKKRQNRRSPPEIPTKRGPHQSLGSVGNGPLQ